MSASITPQSLIEQILQIQQMEHGSISAVGHGSDGPYFNLNSWLHRKNCCRYLHKDKVATVQQAIEGYRKYQQLTQNYTRPVIEKSRAELAIGVKKKPHRKSKPHRPKSSRPKKPKSRS